MENTQTLLGLEGSPTMTRAGFASKNLWVTPYHVDEQWPGGAYDPLFYQCFFYQSAYIYFPLLFTSFCCWKIVYSVTLSGHVFVPRRHPNDPVPILPRCLVHQYMGPSRILRLMPSAPLPLRPPDESMTSQRHLCILQERSRQGQC